ncbi:restriction endonuclease subunit S, partial [Bacteroides nordii]|uniref:restriction endonuclease subunit S n=1 Tax=Bacteroides nordii TaxID=291645 RepID=UPI0034A1C355
MSLNDLLHIKDKSVTTTLSVESLRFSQIYFFAICLFYYLLNEKQNIISHSVGATQPNISQKIISFFPIIYPSLSEQIAIADYLDKKTTQIAAQIKLLETKRDTY